MSSPSHSAAVAVDVQRERGNSAMTDAPVFDGAVYSAADLLVRPNRLKMNTPGTLALRFSWDRAFTTSSEVVGLRQRYLAPRR